MTDKSKQLKIAIIVPYRDIHPAQKRASHLKQFIPYMESFMENAIDKFNKTAKFHIFIIEQSPDHKFNRGELLNIGFDIARKQGYNVFIFHDVDLLPGETISRYYVKDPENPIHIARCWDRYKGQEYLGGIISISEKNYLELNGYPNNYWGWGGEDDELRRRANELQLQIENPEESDCKIKDLEEMTLQEKLQVLKENQDWKNMKKYELKAEHGKTWKINGINSMEGIYTEISVDQINENTTKITVKLINDEEEEGEEEIKPKQDQKKILKKKDSKKITSIYSRGLITRHISLPITAIGKNITETIETNISANFEGKCLVEGYIKPNSSKIISHSSGLITRGIYISFEVIFECEICFPVEGTIVSCTAKNITKAGIKCESSYESPSPIIVFIARDHHYNNTYFTTVKEGDKINIRVIGQRFELNDKYISIIGELVKPKVDYNASNKKNNDFSKPKLIIE